MADVAAQAHIPGASIYRRFRGKDDLILAIKLDATSRIEESVTRHLESATFTDIADVVSRYAPATARAFAKDEALHRLLCSQVERPGLDEIGSSGLLRIFAHYREALAPWLKEFGRARLECKRPAIPS